MQLPLYFVYKPKCSFGRLVNIKEVYRTLMSFQFSIDVYLKISEQLFIIFECTLEIQEILFDKCNHCNIYKFSNSSGKILQLFKFIFNDIPKPIMFLIIIIFQCVQVMFNVFFVLFQGTIQYSKTMHSPPNGPTVCGESSRCSQIHLQPWTQYGR